MTNGGRPPTAIVRLHTYPATHHVPLSGAGPDSTAGENTIVWNVRVVGLPPVPSSRTSRTLPASTCTVPGAMDTTGAATVDDDNDGSDDVVGRLLPRKGGHTAEHTHSDVSAKRNRRKEHTGGGGDERGETRHPQLKRQGHVVHMNQRQDTTRHDTNANTTNRELQRAISYRTLH